MPRSRSKEPQIVEGRIDDSDDEEIDEDEAFNSDDELKYGDLFVPSKKNSNGGKGGKKSKETGGHGGGASGDDDDGESDDDDGGSSDENDWAGSSDDSEEEDDGGQYMLDLLDNLDKKVEPSSGKVEKSDQGSGKRGEGGRISFDNAASEAAARLPEGQFRAGALSAMSAPAPADGANPGGLTLDSLMGGIADTAGFASVQRSMRALSGAGPGDAAPRRVETTAAPVPRAVSERASRRVHSEAASAEATRWEGAVHEQRDAETLDFRTNRGGESANRVTRDTLVEKFEAGNDFEREMGGALEAAGMEDEKAIQKEERRRLTGAEGGPDDDDDDGEEDARGGGADDDLGSCRITAAEYKRRHGELAKLRSLMFHEEQKRHRVNKIKSKKYKKIRKRQRDRLEDAEDGAAGPEGEADDRERAEREEMERMEERMTLAHRNTSKWARRMLRRGSKMETEERRALSLQISKGEELRRKALGVEDDEESESDTEEGLLKKARDILMEDDNNDGDDSGQKKKGLFQMEFMKRGMEVQRTRAKEEARKLLEELEANAVDDSSSDSEDGEGEEEKKKSTTKKSKAAITEEETKKFLPEGKLVASSLQFGKGDGFAIKVDGNIELGGGGGNTVKKTEKKPTESDEMENEQGTTKSKKKRRKKKQKLAAKADGNIVDPVPTSKKANDAVTTPSNTGVLEEEEENPWIVSKSTKKSNKRLSTTVNIKEAASMLVDDPVQNNDTKKRKQQDGKASTTMQSKEKEESDEANAKTTTAPPVATEKEEVRLADLSQAELVRRAFAAPSDLAAAEEEFQKEKEKMKERDDPTLKKTEEKLVTGWGSWAGAGAPPPRTKKPRKPLHPKLRAPTSKKAENKAPKRKDDGLSTVIINEKRLKKTTKFQLSEIPYPYRSREEYERSIAGNIGQEWNTMRGTKEMSRPAVLVRAGKIIQPIAIKAKSNKEAAKAKANKRRRAPAKF